MEVRLLWIGRYFTLAGPAKPIRVARPEAVDLASIKKNLLDLRALRGDYTIGCVYNIWVFARNCG